MEGFKLDVGRPPDHQVGLQIPSERLDVMITTVAASQPGWIFFTHARSLQPQNDVKIATTPQATHYGRKPSGADRRIGDSQRSKGKRSKERALFGNHTSPPKVFERSFEKRLKKCKFGSSDKACHPLQPWCVLVDFEFFPVDLHLHRLSLSGALHVARSLATNGMSTSNCSRKCPRGGHVFRHLR